MEPEVLLVASRDGKGYIFWCILIWVARQVYLLVPKDGFVLDFRPPLLARG